MKKITTPATGRTPLALVLILAGLAAAGAYSYAEQVQAQSDDPFGKRDLTQGNSDERSRYEMAFRDAVIQDKLGLAEAFLRHGMTVNPKVFANGGDDILTDATFFTKDPHMVTMLLAHGAKPLGKIHDWNSTVNRALGLGNKEIADMLIKAGGLVDPIWYDAAFGLLDDLKKRDAATPVSADEARGALERSDPAAFDWLWAKARTGDEKKDTKRLQDLFDKCAGDGRLPLLLHLEQMGVKPAEGGEHALAQAIIWGHEAVAQQLMEMGVVLPPKPDPMKFGYPLRDSAGEGRMDMVTLLLAHGADLNALDSQGFTPLSWCLYNGKDEMGQFLIQQGADINIPNQFGETAVWCAAGSSHSTGALALLLKKGASIKGTDNNGSDILQAATSFMPPQLGVQGFPGDVLTPAEQRAYDTREEQTVDLLVGAGYDPNGKAGTDTPLKIVLESNHYPAARALLRHPIDVNLKDAQGVPAIYYLFAYCHSAFPLDILDALLQKGADPNAVYPEPGVTQPIEQTVFQTALDLVSESMGFHFDDHRAAVQLLIKHGATFPGVTKAADQALLLAAARGDQAAMKDALAQGASPDAADSSGNSPLMLSMSLHFFDNVVWLLQQGANPKLNAKGPANQLLAAAVEANRLDMVKLLLAKGVDPHAGNSALDTTVRNGNKEMFDALLKAGADPKDASLFTCIQSAQPEMARILLDRGVDPQPPAFAENRANVYWAVYYDQPEILKMLLDHGADPTMIVAYGETPLSEAQQFHKDLVPMLQDAINRRQASVAAGAIPEDLKKVAEMAADDFKQGHFDQAAAGYEQMTKTEPSCQFAWSNLGVVRFQQMRYTDARDAFLQAVKLKPTDAFATLNLGITYNRLNAYDQALPVLKTAVQLAPADANAHYFLGLTLAALKQQKDADAEFQKARDLQAKTATTPPAHP